MAPKQVHKVKQLPDMKVHLPRGEFTDKILPEPAYSLKVNEIYTGDYYIALHNITAAAGVRSDGTHYPAYTPNHLGARVRLPHVGMNVNRWRHHLVGYGDIEIIQFIEFGFPLGLSTNLTWSHQQETMDLHTCGMIT